MWNVKSRHIENAFVYQLADHGHPYSLLAVRSEIPFAPAEEELHCRYMLEQPGIQQTAQSNLW